MNNTIKGFIEKQKCANVSCLDTDGRPYCFSCFYAVNVQDGLLYFKSSVNTNHINMLLSNPILAGTILPDKIQMLVVRGIQFRGVLLPQDDARCRDASKHYHSRFPFALAVPGELWTIRLSDIKMTDSSKGFGTKINWSRTEETVISN